MAWYPLRNFRLWTAHTTTRRPTPNDAVFFYPLHIKLSRFEVTVKENSIMFLNMSYSANSCSLNVVSNASAKVTKKSKHTNKNQNITTNSKTTFTCASPWHKNTLLFQHNHKLRYLLLDTVTGYRSQYHGLFAIESLA